MLNGIVGLLLGWVAVPALLVALLLQAVLFQFGGLTTLGVNTVIMAAPAVIGHYLFRSLIWRKALWSLSASFACGFAAVLISALVAALALMFTDAGFWHVAVVLAGAHVPVMIIEGVVTAFCVAFLRKVHPVMLSAGSGRPPY
jgi:cobalt/nickel transport system permease protein